MANLTPIPSWDDVVQLETTTPALAGPGGIMNAQAQALLNRLAFLQSSAGGSLLGFLQAGVGAVPRTVQGKQRDLVDVRDFGVTGSGANEAVALQKALDTGQPLDFGNLRIVHSGVVATITSGKSLHWEGRGAKLVYTGAGEGVRVTTPVNTNVSGVFVSGIEFSGGAKPFYVIGASNKASIISDVEIVSCRFIGGTVNEVGAACWLEFCDRVEIHSCYAYLGIDNGIYTAYCKNVNIHHNIVHNCKGLGIASGYCWEDVPPFWNAENLIIDSNIVYCDNNAPAPSGANTSYIAGIEPVFVYGYRIVNNLIVNRQTTAFSESRSMRQGIQIDEFTILDGVVEGNTVLNMWDSFILTGYNLNTNIRRLKIRNNYFSGCGGPLYTDNEGSGLQLMRITEALEITGNYIEGTQGHGVHCTPTVTAYGPIKGNTFAHCGIRNTSLLGSPSGNSYPCSVYVQGTEVQVLDNTFNTGNEAIYITSSATTPTVRVDPSTKIITLTDGAGTVNTNYAAMTFGDVAEWIRLRTNWQAQVFQGAVSAWAGGVAYKPGDVRSNGGLLYQTELAQDAGFSASVAPPNAGWWTPQKLDNGLSAAKYLRRTGRRSSVTVLDYPVGAQGLKLTSTENYLCVYIAWPTFGNCVVRGNTLNTKALEYPVVAGDGSSRQGFAQGNPYWFEKTDTVADVLESGGGRVFYGAVSRGVTQPSNLSASGYYIEGDRFYADDTRTQPGGWVCTQSGMGSLSAWATVVPSPKFGAQPGVATAISNNASATVTVTVTGAVPSVDSYVLVTTNAANTLGVKIFGYVSAVDTVIVRYENNTGSSQTLGAHTVTAFFYTAVSGIVP